MQLPLPPSPALATKKEHWTQLSEVHVSGSETLSIAIPPSLPIKCPQGAVPAEHQPCFWVLYFGATCNGAQGFIKVRVNRAGDEPELGQTLAQSGQHNFPLPRAPK